MQDLEMKVLFLAMVAILNGHASIQYIYICQNDWDGIWVYMSGRTFVHVNVHTLMFIF